MNSYITNCYISQRSGEDFPLFNQSTGEVRLDRYAIVPLEDYLALLPPEKRRELSESA